jgi:hypothetical protein
MQEAEMIIIGMDPGVTGAFAALNTHCGAVEFLDMPTFQVKSGKKNKSEYDARAIADWLNSQSADRMVHAVIEKQQAMPPELRGQRQGNVSTGMVMYGYGILIGVLSAVGIPFDRVAARSWKAKILKDLPSGKDSSIICAKQMFPIAADRLARKKDHGRAEALLIAAYGQRYLGIGSGGGVNPLF